MQDAHKAVASCRLYGILDLGYSKAGDLAAFAESLSANGIDILQIRAKNHDSGELAAMVRDVLAVTRQRGVPLIVNDHPRVAAETGAEGVHVGQGDASVASVRDIVGRPCLVGKSTHSLAQARAAGEEGADYIGFGPLFTTPTKPDYRAIGSDDIQSARQSVSIPVFCIGGIKLENCDEVLAAGARRIVVVSGILQAENPGEYVAGLRAKLDAVPMKP